MPLLDRNYAVYWLGRTASFCGDQFQTVALAIVALDLTHSTTGLGAVLTVQAVPRAVLMLFGGAVTDRFRARTVMLVSDLLQSTVVLALALLAFSGTLALWHLLIYAALSGTVFAFFLPASNTIVPDLVPGEEVQAANALGGVAANLSLFLIPPIAGLVIASVGAAPAFTVNGLALLGSVATLWFVRQKSRVAIDGHVESPNVLRHLGQSFAAARRDTPILLALVIAEVFCLGFFGATFVAIPALAKLSLGAGDAGVGVLLGARGVGALVGGIVAGSVAIRRMGLTFCLLILGIGLAQVAGALAPTLWTAAIPFALSGAFVAAATIIFFTLLQTRAPEEHRGGIMGLASLAIFGVTPLGYAVAGVIGAVLGPRGALLFGASCVFASGALGLSSKGMRDA